MKKRLTAMLMVVALLVSLMPMGVLADAPDVTADGTYNDKETAKEATGVTANKTVTENADGTYTVTLSVEGYTDTSSETKYLPADIVLVVDTSTSMEEAVTYKTCGSTEFDHWGLWYCSDCGEGYLRKPDSCTKTVVDKNRLDVAKDAASQFVSGLLGASDEIRIGLYDFSGSNRTNVPLTNKESTLLSAIENLYMPDWGDGTDYGLGLDGAQNILEGSSNERSKFVVFLSDGEPQGGDNGVWEANELKNAGVTIFTVGIDTGSTGSAARALRNISSQDEDENAYFYAASSDGSSGAALADILNQISETIQSSIQAGTDAIMTDVINTESFELVPGSPSEGLTVGSDGKTLTWNIGDITSAPETVSFKIKLKDDNTASGSLHTNSNVSLKFDSSKLDGEEVTFNKGAIGDPTVDVYKVTYTDGVEGENVFADQVTYNLRSGAATPAFEGTPTRDGYTFVGWNPTVAETVTEDVTYSAVWEKADPDMYPTANPITIKVVLDGDTEHEISGSSINTYISVNPYKNETDAGDSDWNPGTYEDGTVTYSVTYYDCKDIGFAAEDGYVIEAIDAQTVFGQSGSKGIYAIDDESLAQYGEYMADNVKGGSTVTVYVRTEYTVDYFVNGNEYEGDTDDGYYVSGTTYSASNAKTDAPVNPIGDEYEDIYYPVDCGCTGEEEHTGHTDVNGAQPGVENLFVVSGLDTDITFIKLPSDDDGAYNVAGWYVGQHGNSGDTYSSTHNVSEFVGSLGSDNVIKFNATKTKNQVTITIKYEADDGTDLGKANVTNSIDFGASYSYEVGSDEIPRNITAVNGDNYTFDSVKSGALSGENVTSNVEITVVYSKDEVGPGDEPDGTPDKYQVTVNYVATDDGSIAESATTKEVLTIYSSDELATSGTVTATGSQAVANDEYFFDKWTMSTNGGDEIDTDLEANTGSINLNVTGGDVITFTAYFEAKTYGLDVEKTLVTVGNTQIEEGTEIPDANVGEQIIWNIKVTNTGNQPLSNITVTDNMVNASGTVELTGTDDTIVDIDGTTATISELEPGQSVVITATYTVLANDVGKTLNNSVSVADKGGHEDGDTPDEGVTVSDYSVTITPADIIAYTGGTAYGAIVDENGNEIGTTESGLPEPGYHITLSPDVQKWLTENGTEVGDGNATEAANLAGVLKFTYNVNGVTREWALRYVGVYSTNEDNEPTAYVYSLEPSRTETGDTIPVRIRYMNNGEVVSSDDILMRDDYVNDIFTMTIEPGELDQDSIQAVLTAGNDESITAKVNIGTGELTVLSTTNEEYTTDLNTNSSNRITADVNDGTTFTVNDSEVTLEPEDVKLLVDSVSNNDDFNAALEDDARDHVDMSDAGTESFYLDLVHADNGNVQVGLDGSLTISWPMPDDADPDGEFTIVHYVDMDRSAVMGEDNLANAVKEEIRVTPNGDQLIFDVDSFSPFVLVYETDDGYEPIIPTPDDDTEYVPKWLNTEDHFAYIVGYEDGEVKPNNNITRAEVATIFFRLLTDDARARYWSQTNDYSDIAPESWYNNAVSTLSNMGIINGYEDGTFKPNAPITRAEFTAIATRFFDYTAEYEGAFNDVSRSAWYADCVQAAVDMGLVDGYPDGGFHPNSNITRAEAVTIVNRVLNRAPHEDHLLDEDEMNVWPDNVYGAWYYADMQEATNSHDYDWIRVSGERVEEWTEKLPERDWAALEQEWSSAYSG